MMTLTTMTKASLMNDMSDTVPIMRSTSAPPQLSADSLASSFLRHAHRGPPPPQPPPSHLHHLPPHPYQQHEHQQEHSKSASTTTIDPRATYEYWLYYFSQRPLDHRLLPPLANWTNYHHCHENHIPLTAADVASIAAATSATSTTETKPPTPTNGSALSKYTAGLPPPHIPVATGAGLSASPPGNPLPLSSSQPFNRIHREAINVNATAASSSFSDLSISAHNGNINKAAVSISAYVKDSPLSNLNRSAVETQVHLLSASTNQNNVASSEPALQKSSYVTGHPNSSPVHPTFFLPMSPMESPLIFSSDADVHKSFIPLTLQDSPNLSASTPSELYPMMTHVNTQAQVAQPAPNPMLAIMGFGSYGNLTTNNAHGHIQAQTQYPHSRTNISRPSLSSHSYYQNNRNIKQQYRSTWNPTQDPFLPSFSASFSPHCSTSFASHPQSSHQIMSGQARLRHGATIAMHPARTPTSWKQQNLAPKQAFNVTSPSFSPYFTPFDPSSYASTAERATILSTINNSLNSDDIYHSPQTMSCNSDNYLLPPVSPMLLPVLSSQMNPSLSMYVQQPVALSPQVTSISAAARLSWMDDFRLNHRATDHRAISIQDILARGIVLEMSCDQHGSRFIQQKLEMAPAEERAQVFAILQPQLLRLCQDVFANYVVQRFLEFGSPEQRVQMITCLQGQVLFLSLHTYACRVVQKALEVSELEQQAIILRELQGHIVQCIKDSSGNHVIQKSVERCPPQLNQFIVDSLHGCAVALSCHAYGCRVVQRLLEHGTESQRAAILEEVFPNIEELCRDMYGNYVVQHVLIHGSAADRTVIITGLHGRLLTLSKQKFASNVIEKCFAHASRNDRQILIDEILGDPNTSNESSVLLGMAKDQFANFVLQRLVDVLDREQLVQLVQRIRKFIPQLRKLPYGRHIIVKLSACLQNHQIPAQSMLDP